MSEQQEMQQGARVIYWQTEGRLITTPGQNDSHSVTWEWHAHDYIVASVNMLLSRGMGAALTRYLIEHSPEARRAALDELVGAHTSEEQAAALKERQAVVASVDTRETESAGDKWRACMVTGEGAEPLLGWGKDAAAAVSNLQEIVFGLEDPAEEEANDE